MNSLAREGQVQGHSLVKFMHSLIRSFLHSFSIFRGTNRDQHCARQPPWGFSSSFRRHTLGKGTHNAGHRNPRRHTLTHQGHPLEMFKSPVWSQKLSGVPSLAQDVSVGFFISKQRSFPTIRDGTHSRVTYGWKNQHMQMNKNINHQLRVSAFQVKFIFTFCLRVLSNHSTISLSSLCKGKEHL